MPQILIAAVLWLLCLGSGASADEATIQGPGASSCTQFAPAYARDPIREEEFYHSWALGFMSGRNWVPTSKTYTDIGACSKQYTSKEIEPAVC
jgi:hypothetical protein